MGISGRSRDEYFICCIGLGFAFHTVYMYKVLGLAFHTVYMYKVLGFAFHTVYMYMYRGQGLAFHVHVLYNRLYATIMLRCTDSIGVGNFVYMICR